MTYKLAFLILILAGIRYSFLYFFL